MKIKYLMASIAACALLFSCSKSQPEESFEPELSDYVGTVTVAYDGSVYENEDISVNFTPSEDGKTADITIYKIKVVPAMPQIDVTVPGVKVESKGDGLSLSCDNVNPLAMGGEFPRYLVTGFEGTLDDEGLTFSLNFGSYPTSFEGVKK